MDRNQIIGLVLMLVFITVYFQFFAPEPVLDQPKTEQVMDSTSVSATSAQVQASSTLSDSTLLRLNELKYGVFSPAGIGTETIVKIENENLVAYFSTRGGMIKKVILKDFTDFKGEPLVLLDEEHSNQHIYVDHLSKQIDLSELYFTSNLTEKKINGTDTARLEFSMSLPNGLGLTYQYSIPGNGYAIKMKIKQNGLQAITSQNPVFAWNQRMMRVEKDPIDARNRTTVKYQTADGEVDELSASSSDHEEELLELPTNWVSFKQKFFTSAIIGKSQFTNGRVTSDVNLADTTSVKNLAVSVSIPYQAFASNDLGFTFFYGPNDYTILKKVSDGFEENLDLGWGILGWINKFAIIPIFHFLEQYITNYGIIIIIMVIILKLVLSPLTYSSHMGMAKMRVLKPELDEIKEKNDGDLQKTQQEQMALYQKVGINPLAGCIPMLLQMPILIAMFYFFPNSIELRQQPFLWADDLSTFDSIWNMPFSIPFYGDHVSLFTLLMTASTILYTWSNSQMTTSLSGPMKTLQYVMPIMFLFFLNSYSAGLTFYYFVSNIVSFGQIYLFKRLIDENKILAILEENRKKNATKKKSSFQSRIEEAMKASEQARKDSKKKK